MTWTLARRILVGVLLPSMFAPGVTRAELAPNQIGIVLMHGKLGEPLGSGSTAFGRQVIGSRLVSALKSAGYLIETPSMCWSAARSFDLPYADCLREIDTVIASLKSRGASAIVVAGMSLGGNAALGYGATHPGLLGIIGFAPADDPKLKAKRPEVAAFVAAAEQLVAQGKGDEKTALHDFNTGRQGSYEMLIETTPRIYLSFLGPESQAGLADNASKLTAPLLWIAGSRDPTQRREPGYAFDKAPPNPLNRFISVSANHPETPDADVQGVLDWLKQVAAVSRCRPGDTGTDSAPGRCTS